MTMHHDTNEEKHAVRQGSIVRATKRVIDADAADTWPDHAVLALLDRGGGQAVAAERGDRGRVEHAEEGVLVVSFEHAPCAVSVSEDEVEPLLTLLAGGLS